MKDQPKLSEMIKDQVFEGYLFVKAAAQKTGARGKYLDMELCDSSGSVRSKMWDGVTDVPAADTVIRVHGSMTEFNGQPQLRIRKLRLTGSNDDFDLELLKPAAPAAKTEPVVKPEPEARTAPAAKCAPLSELHDGERFDGFLLTRAAEQRTDKNGKTYFDMTLCDATASINAKAFAKAIGDQKMPDVGTVLHITGVRQTYNNTHIQLILDTMRPASNDDHYDMSTLIACAPYPPEQMRSALYTRANAIHDEDLKKLVLARLDQCGEKLDYYPAASKLHHAEKSGLLHHTTTMLKMGDYVCIVYPNLDADLVAAGVILHDLCKLEEMDSDAVGVVSDYTAQGNLLGHLVTGVAEIDRLGHELNTRAELLMMVEHMILSHHDLPEYGSPKPPMFPEAEVLHTLDLLDSRMFEMERELKSAVPGGFTERIWSLDRKLYRRKETPKA